MAGPFANYPSLKDRVVFVTGGGSGIGAAIVERFCEQGAKVSFVDLNAAASKGLVAAITTKGWARPSFIACDLKDIEALRAAIKQTIEQNGPIRALVNNAANDDRHRLDDITPAYFDNRIAVNVRHQLFAAQAVRRSMAEAGGGSIINMGSITYVVGQGGMACYSLAKSAVWGLTRSLATDLGPENIRVNMVMPGWVMTERQKTLWLTPESEAEMMKSQCLKRHLMPDDLARAVLFLAADDSAMCTAQSFVVDGGWS